MINLLPENEKNILRKEYRARKIAVALIFLFACSMISLIVLLPSYSLSYNHKVASEQKIIAEPATQLEKETSLSNSISETKSLTEALKPMQTSVNPTNIIDLLIKDRGTTRITSILYSQDDTGVTKVTVQGVAKTRESLVAFTKLLESESGVSDVNLPISDLTKDANIQFSFDMTIKHQ